MSLTGGGTATPAAVIAAPTAWMGQVHHPRSQSQTYQLHPLLSAHLLGVGDVLLDRLGVVPRVPVECEASRFEQSPPLAKVGGQGKRLGV